MQELLYFPCSAFMDYIWESRKFPSNLGHIPGGVDLQSHVQVYQQITN